MNQLTVRAGAILETNGDTLMVSGDLDASGSITGPGIVSMTGDGKTIRGSVPNLLATGTIGLSGNVIAAGNVTIPAGATLNTNGDTIRASGDLEGSAPIVGPGLVVLTGAAVTARGSVPDLQIEGTTSLSNGLTVSGNLAIVGTGARFALNGYQLADSGDLNLVGGRLVMNSPSDFLLTRALNISGPRNDTLLDGVIQIGGDFHEFCGAPSCAASFFTGGKFEFQFDYQGLTRAQSIFLDDPSAWWFNNMRFTGSPDSVVFRTNARILGDVLIPGDNVVYSDPADTVFLCGNVDPASAGSWLATNTVLCNPPDSLRDSLATLYPAYARNILHWRDNSTNEGGFQVERCQGAGCSTFIQIGTTGANVTSFGDSVQLAAIYYYRVRSSNAVGASAYSDTAGVTTPELLQNGQLVDVSVPTGSQAYYAIHVPAGQTQLTIVTSFGTQNPGSGDADLYVRFGGQPTLTMWDCRPFTPFNAEQCTFPNPPPGDWHIMVNAVAGFSGVSLTASY